MFMKINKHGSHRIAITLVLGKTKANGWFKANPIQIMTLF